MAPTRMVYGDEIVGRQADLHAVISQFSSPRSSEVLTQPLTTTPGWALARMVSPVAALNVMVLLTFPLTALATFALARYLHRSNVAAIAAALIFSFSPTHLAQAAYHPYTAQIQWIPLYFLALIALVDRASAWRIAALVAASAALIFSNYEAALIAALVTPVAIVAFWAIRTDVLDNYKPLIWPFAVYGAVVVGAIVIALVLRPAVFSRAYMLQFPIDEIALYRARWWAYFTPSVDHPLLGAVAWDVLGRFGINLGLLEQQIFVGFAFTALAVVALAVSAWTWRPEWRYVVAIGAVGLAAALISVGPATGSCEPFSVAPACLFFRIVPVFRAYARFAIIVNLMVAIAAGAGAAMLAGRSRGGQIAAAILLLIGTFEFWPLPVRAHDVLPTAAHRWLVVSARRRSRVRLLSREPGGPVRSMADAATAVVSGRAHQDVQRSRTRTKTRRARLHARDRQRRRGLVEAGAAASVRHQRRGKLSGLSRLHHRVDAAAGRHGRRDRLL